MKMLPEILLSGSKRDYPLEFVLQPAISTLNGERTLLHFVLPPWQRDEVWDAARKKSFIEGIFLGLGTGFYVVHGQEWEKDGTPKPMSGWLIDGQQRLSAIRDFVQNELEIFDGIRYSDLDIVEKRRRFENVVFPAVELMYQGDERVLKELYMRLNFGGVSHTQEDARRVDLNANALGELSSLGGSSRSRPRQR